MADKVDIRFLWVTFQIESICRENTDEGILKALEDLPKDLPTTYRRMLRRLHNSESTEPSMGKKVFEIVSAARRPLTLEELREAVSIEPGSRYWNTTRMVNDAVKLLGCCGSLVIVDEEFSTVHFAHSSVKQHLETKPIRDDISEYHIATKKARLLMGEIVVTYLNLFDVRDKMCTKASDLPQRPVTNEASVLLRASLPPQNFATNLARKLLKSRKTPGHDMGHDLERVACFKGEQQMQPLEAHSFLSYAQEHWLFHTELFRFFRFEGNGCYSLWKDLINGVVPTIELPWTRKDASALNSSFLYRVAQSQHAALTEYACHSLVREKKPFLEIQKFVNSLPPYDLVYKERVSGSYYDEVLFEAVLENNKDLVHLLLDKTSADVNLRVRGYSSMLNHALKFRSFEIVKELIRHGADVNAKEVTGESPLELAAGRSPDARETVLLLLASGTVKIHTLEHYSDVKNWVLGESYDIYDKWAAERSEIRKVENRSTRKQSFKHKM